MLISNMHNYILNLYGFDINKCTIKPFGNGLINQTWIISLEERKYILQKINTLIFKSPHLIAKNIHEINAFLKEKFPEYLFVNPITSLQNEEMTFIPNDGYYRIFPFVEGSVTFTFLNDTNLAFEAAKQFGKLTHVLSTFDIDKLEITLPDFHNLNLRYQQFETSLKEGNVERIKACKPVIDSIKAHKNIVTIFDEIQTNKNFKIRVNHNDTKISNVLFSTDSKALCVIDLDTIMPGYFISDVGDMLRTYLSPVSEEENNLSKIEIREEYFEAIMQGYFSEMNDELSVEEKKYFVYAGIFMIYMQALRFLTDHINNDIYYGAKYEGHNLNRCNNQMELLKKLLVKEDLLQKKVIAYLLIKDKNK